MYDPKEIFTKAGLLEHEHHLYNMRKAVSFLRSNTDDLGIGSLDDAQVTVLDDLEDMIEIYENGDGEKFGE